jgi:hypothetical protein
MPTVFQNEWTRHDFWTISTASSRREIQQGCIVAMNWPAVGHTSELNRKQDELATFV